MKRNYGAFQVMVARTRRIPIPGGFTTVSEPAKAHTVLVDIDMDRLAILLGHKAAKSKSGKSNLLGGVITVTEKRR